MKNEKLSVVILAAGLGKRMKSDLPKVTVPTVEKPMICHVLDAVSGLSPEKTAIVTGYKREYVEEVVQNHNFQHPVEFAFQEEQLGTGHAVQCAESALKDFSGVVLILYGDVPLITEESLAKFLDSHQAANATLSIISADVPKPANFGRIVRDSSANFLKIVEAKDCSSEELLISEVNSGIYAVDSAFLWPAINGLENSNAQNEFYLTDICETAVKEGQIVHVWQIDDEEETQGVNSRVELAGVNRLLRQKQINHLLAEGVNLEDPDSLYLNGEITISPGARIGPNVKLEGKVHIEKDVVIEGNCILIDCTVKSGTLLKWGIRAESSTIGVNCKIGPFTHLRPGAELHEEVKVGNFVEVKKAVLENGVAASHLSYIGDARVGQRTNIGAGTITCNYDGANKHFTEIGEDVFVGSNSTLIAPIKIGDKAVIGAGSSLSKDVPAGSLALTRPGRLVKENYKRKTKNEK